MWSSLHSVRWNGICPTILLVLYSIFMSASKSEASLSQEGHSNHHHSTPSTVEFTIDPKMTSANVKGHQKVVVCYLGTWATYRKGDGSFDLLAHFDPNLCTHLIYSFAGLDNHTNFIKVMDPFLDLEANYGKGWYKKATGLKEKYPHLKVLLAVGGWNEGSISYSNMVADQASRKLFITSALDLVRKHGFDGLDVDWEFPSERGGIPEDRHLFTVLLRELREEFDPYGLMLTAAFSASPTIAAKAYELPEVSRLLHHIHIMCYDIHGAWDRKTGHNAPIRGGSLNVEHSVDHFIREGVPPEKLVLGVPFYGRTFLLEETGVKSSEGKGINETALLKGFQGPLTKEDGYLGYNEICNELNSNRGDWKTFWDGEAEVPYMRQGAKWVSFDNPESIQRKVEFAQSRGLKGLMVWSIDTDDFLGRCGPKYPLLTSINYALSSIAPKSSPPKTVGGSTSAFSGGTGSPLVLIAATLVVKANLNI